MLSFIYLVIFNAETVVVISMFINDNKTAVILCLYILVYNNINKSLVKLQVFYLDTCFITSYHKMLHRRDKNNW